MTPKSVTVATATPYQVYAEPALDLGAAVNQKTLPPGAAIILTDSTVGPLHAPSVALRNACACGGSNSWNPMIDAPEAPILDTMFGTRSP